MDLSQAERAEKAMKALSPDEVFEFIVKLEVMVTSLKPSTQERESQRQRLAR